MKMPIGTTSMQILSVLDNGPTYAAKMLEKYPTLATTREVDGVLVIDPGGLYVRLSRLVKRKLIERIKNYKPPRGSNYSRQARTRAVWYRLTPKGRELLHEHRRLIGT